MAKTLLVIGAGRESIPALRRARQLGYHLVATDGNSQAPGFAYVDEAIFVSTYAVEETVAYAVEYVQRMGPIHGVIALAADVPQTVAAVMTALGLPGISVETARLTSDKFAMKLRFLETGIPIPWFAAVASARFPNCEELRTLVGPWDGVPLVLKPVDSRGARGVLRLTRGVDLAWAFAHSQSHSPTGRVMLEQWLEGPQISTETVLHDGWAETPGFIDRNYSRLDEFAPHIIEDGGEQPSILSPADQQAICDVAERAARALGITEGIAKGDMVLTPDGPQVIEMAARLSGGYMSSVQVGLATGIDVVGIAIKLATGEPVTRHECMASRPHGVAIRYVFAAPGRVGSIQGLEAVHAFPGVHFVDIPLRVDDEIAVTTNHTQRAGCVIATGMTREEAVARAERAVQHIVVEMEPL